nr:hypothetical protein [Sphingomonas sp. H160509]
MTVKRDEYRAIDSIDTLAFVDVDAEALSVHQRIEGGWIETLFSTSLHLVIPSLGLTIPNSEIFARD